MSDSRDPNEAAHAQELAEVDDCGCCKGMQARTPVQVHNRPGRNAIAYRVGTHARFLRSMTVGLSDAELPALQGLTTRDSGSFSIALLDAWATIADVLTFYQERIANESYLKTATEPKSISELGRLIGCRPKPGVAASTHLAFTLEDAPGSATRTTIDIGTKVQSVPGPGEQPQIFETIEKIEARAEWNVIKPRMTERVDLEPDAAHMYVKGANTNLKPGDGLLFVRTEFEQTGSSAFWDFHRVTQVDPDQKIGRTRIQWAGGLTSRLTNPQVYAMRVRAPLFGYNAPDPMMISKLMLFRRGLHDWKFKISGQTIYLDTSYPGVRPTSWLVLMRPNDGTPGNETYRNLCRVDHVDEATQTKYLLSGKTTRIVFELLDMGKSSVAETKKEKDEREKRKGTRLQGFQGGHYRHTTVFTQSEPLERGEEPLFPRPDGSGIQKLTFEPGTLLPVEGKEVTLDGQVERFEIGRTLIISGRRMRARVTSDLSLKGESGILSPTIPPGETLVILEAPAIQSDKTVKWRLRSEDGFEGTVVTDIGQLMLTSAASKDPMINEVVSVASAEGYPTRVVLGNNGLVNVFDRTSVEIAGNVVRATHGETVHELLGSGDAALQFQKFTLNQSPLTYVSAATASGSESTLKVFVNDIQWHEVPTLFQRQEDEHIFITDVDDQGRTTIKFGDGRTGARLPSGSGNVRAEYRKGIGSVTFKPGQLRQLITRPLGVKAVTNPLAASGGEDGPSQEDIRRNTPSRLLTMGSLVSLWDYEQFAGAFPGIAKAHAKWIGDNQSHRVFITVAGANGSNIGEDSDTYRQLTRALRELGDLRVSPTVKSYRSVTFRMAGKVNVDPDFVPADVLANVRKALSNEFSFNSRKFGEQVTKSQVIAVMQNVRGVVSVCLEQLSRTDEPPGDKPVDVLPSQLHLTLGKEAELPTLDESSLAAVKVAV
jgi:hypothetical protein